MLVVVAKALISLDVDDMAALRITAIISPINPLGRWFKIKFIKI
jgi:hypothetical protein